MTDNLRYNVTLNEDVENILSSDVWVMKNLTRDFIPLSSDPIKFSAEVIVYVRKGSGTIDINLIPYQVEAPCVINIHKSQILQIRELTPDISAGVIVMSKRFSDNIFMRMKDCGLFAFALGQQVVKVQEKETPKFERHFDILSEIAADKGNPYAYQANVLEISSFFYHTGHKCYLTLSETLPKGTNKIPEKFVTLVQQNYKTERFLQFYADKLQITPKHLSRTMKKLTGFSAVDWIERYVVLEAKVYLKSTSKSIQQIAEELNFPSQSFFGKYFKKSVGMSPKEFRNS